MSEELGNMRVRDRFEIIVEGDIFKTCMNNIMKIPEWMIGKTVDRCSQLYDVPGWLRGNYSILIIYTKK
jgi:hypothetical protein